MDRVLVPLGNLLFRHRNWIFPVLVGLVFAIAPPPPRVFGSQSLEHAKDIVALIIAVVGLVVRALVIGYRHVQRSGVNRSINATTLHTTEVFALCRNPLYLGNMLIVIGIFLMHGQSTVFIVGVLSFLLVYVSLVSAEESYLTTTFGPEYARYCAAVPRWIPGLHRVPGAFASSRFDGRRVLLVEYTNIGITAIALSAAKLYQELANPTPLTGSHQALLLTGLVVLSLVWIAAVRFVKKARIVVST